MRLIHGLAISRTFSKQPKCLLNHKNWVALGFFPPHTETVCVCVCHDSNRKPTSVRVRKVQFPNRERDRELERTNKYFTVMYATADSNYYWSALAIFCGGKKSIFSVEKRNTNKSMNSRIKTTFGSVRMIQSECSHDDSGIQFIFGLFRKEKKMQISN